MSDPIAERHAAATMRIAELAAALREAQAERDALAEELLDIRGSFPIPKERRLAVARAIYALTAKGEG